MWIKTAGGKKKEKGVSTVEKLQVFQVRVEEAAGRDCGVFLPGEKMKEMPVKNN